MNFNLDLMTPYENEVRDAIAEVITDRHYIHGPQMEKFERDFSAYTNSQETVGVGSGTDAIRIALLALGIGPGDEVISPAFNVAYTALAVAAVGATNVYADCNLATGLMDPADVQRRITDKTRAIIPVHLFGQMVDMNEILAIAVQYSLVVIEDAAQCHGAMQDNSPVGAGSDAVAYSFYPTKNLGALGEAGAITTNLPIVAQRARLLRDGGRTDRYQHALIGINSGLDEIQAAVLNVKLRYLSTRNNARGRAAEYYTEKLQGVGPVQMLHTLPGNFHVHHLYVVRAEKRDELREHLHSRGIPTLIHYPIPVPYQPCFMSATFGGPWPHAEALARTVMSLPMHPDITHVEQDQVINAIKEFYA